MPDQVRQRLRERVQGHLPVYLVDKVTKLRHQAKKITIDLVRISRYVNLGMGCPELGSVSIAELLSVAAGWGITLQEKD